MTRQRWHAHRIGDVVQMVANAFVQPDVVVVVPVRNSIVPVGANADPRRPSKLGARNGVTARLQHSKTVQRHVAID